MDNKISNFLINYIKNIKHSNVSLMEHLIGVYNVLKKLNQSEDVCLAGLFHSIYGTDTFKLNLNIKRDDIKKLIGNYSEELVFDFSKQKNKENFYLNNVNYSSKKKDLDLFYISYANLKEQCDRIGSFSIKEYVYKYEQKINDLVAKNKIKKKEYFFDKKTFIGGWYIPKKVCDDMILYFHKNKNKQYPGLQYDHNKELDKVNTNVKESIDLTITTDMFKDNEVFNYIQQLSDVIINYEKKYPMAKNNSPYALIDFFYMQHYPPGGGFKVWHHERFKSSQNRLFVFMTYLNDVPNGGTKFFHQKIISPAKKGLTLMWPADWTHTHKGQITKKHEKYIITGWFKFL